MIPSSDLKIPRPMTYDITEALPRYVTSVMKLAFSGAAKCLHGIESVINGDRCVAITELSGLGVRKNGTRAAKAAMTSRKEVHFAIRYG